MIVTATQDEARAVVRAMAAVASSAHQTSLSAADRRGIASAMGTVFRHHDAIEIDNLSLISPPELAAAVAGPELRLNAVRLLAVMALTDAVIEDAKLAMVGSYADALDVHADFVTALTALLRNDVAWAAVDQIRHNVATIPGMPWEPDHPYAPFLPYGGDGADPALVARYDALQTKPPGSLGRAFYDHYRLNGYAFAGDPAGLSETWATPHDTLHVLSGYSTSAQGELLVAAFTAAAKKDNTDMMESHVLPTILIYHMGIDMNKGLNAGDRQSIAADPSWRDNYQGDVHLGLDAAKLWVAWDRGAATVEDVYSGHWDFWSAVDVQVDELRRRYAISPLDPADAALPDEEVRREDFVRAGMPPPPDVNAPGVGHGPALAG